MTDNLTTTKVHINNNITNKINQKNGLTSKTLGHKKNLDKFWYFNPDKCLLLSPKI